MPASDRGGRCSGNFVKTSQATTEAMTVMTTTGASKPMLGDSMAPPEIRTAAAAGPAIWPSVKPEVSVEISSIRSSRLVRSAT